MVPHPHYCFPFDVDLECTKSRTVQHFANISFLFVCIILSRLARISGFQVQIFIVYLIKKYYHINIQCWHRQSSFSVNRSFCQICQNCIREQNSAKKLPLTGVEPSTLGLCCSFLVSHALPLC